MSQHVVHVHLDAGRSPATWERLVASRSVWESDPYGYRALGDFYTLTYSCDAREVRPVALARRAARKAFGLDLLHAWRNRLAICSADHVVTHTENEFLAVLLLLRLLRDDRPAVICQAVWLWDCWPLLGRVRRRCYRALMARAAVLTTLSRDNLEVARASDCGRPAVLVPYGIRPLPLVPMRSTEHAGLRVASAGNDRDRDWPTLAAAIARLPDVETRVRTRSGAARRAFTGRSASVAPSTSVDAYWADLAWCDVVVVPLRENLHASGVTVVLEAVTAGRPVVVADVGGLRDYFGDGVVYYRAGDVDALVEAIERAATTGPRAQPGEDANSLVHERGLRSLDYAHRHVLLIEALRSGAAVPPAVSRFARPVVDGVAP